MRLAFDATALLGSRTGIGTFTDEVLRRLAAPPSPDRPTGEATPLAIVAFGITWRGRRDLATLVPAGVAVAARPMAARPLRRAWQRAAIPPIEWFTGAVDVVHGPNFVVPPARRAAEVVTVHDLTCVRFPELCTADVLEYPDLLRRAIGRGAWVHTVSAAVAAEVADAFAVPADRLRVVPNGAPAALPAVAVAELATAGRRLVGAPYVLSLGTVEPRKDLPGLVAAFDAVAADHPELRLVIAGPDGWGAEALTTAVAAAHHCDRIVRLGWVSDADRAALLAGAEVFAYPSRYEGFGLPPLEAAAHATPVVATRTGALPEVLDDAAEWAEVGDPDSLAAALTAVLTEPDRAEELVAAGHRRLHAWSWDTTATGLRHLYRDAVEG